MIECTRQSAYLRHATSKTAQCRYRRLAGANPGYVLNDCQNPINSVSGSSLRVLQISWTLPPGNCKRTYKRTTAKHYSREGNRYFTILFCFFKLFIVEAKKTRLSPSRQIRSGVLRYSDFINFSVTVLCGRFSRLPPTSWKTVFATKQY